MVAGHEGGELRYTGPGGDDTFFGPQIDRQDSGLGTRLTVTLRPNADARAIRLTVIVPTAFGVSGAPASPSPPWRSRPRAAGSLPAPESS